MLGFALFPLSMLVATTPSCRGVGDPNSSHAGSQPGPDSTQHPAGHALLDPPPRPPPAELRYPVTGPRRGQPSANPCIDDNGPSRSRLTTPKVASQRTPVNILAGLDSSGLYELANLRR